MPRKPDSKAAPRQMRPLQPQVPWEAPDAAESDHPAFPENMQADQGELPNQALDAAGEAAPFEEYEEFLGEAGENPDAGHEVAQVPEEAPPATLPPQVLDLPPDVAAALAGAIAENAAELASDSGGQQNQVEPMRMAPRPSNPMHVAPTSRRTGSVAVPVPLTSPQALRATQSHRLTHRVGPGTASQHLPSHQFRATAQQFPADPGAAPGEIPPAPQAHAQLHAPGHPHPPPAPWPKILMGAGAGLLLGILLVAFTPIKLVFGLRSSGEIRRHARWVLEEERNQVQSMLDSQRSRLDLRSKMEDFRAERQKKAPEDMDPKDL